MRKTVTTGHVLLIWLLCLWQPAAAEEAGEVYEYVLDNGMKILVRPDRRAPVVVSQLWYKVGSGYEHSGITGLSHMLEHMMFKGTDDLEPGEFSEIIAENGGRENAATGTDYTWYFQSIAADRLALCMELEAERMRDLRITEEEFLKEREVVAEERRTRVEDQPPSLTYEQFIAAAHVNGPYHHMPIGWMTDILSYTVDDARRWYRMWYAPNNATLVIVGDVDPDEVHALARKHFRRLKPSEIPELKPRTESPQQGPRNVEVRAAAHVPHLFMGYKVPSLKTAEDPAEAYALEVLAGILDGGESARLSRNIIRGRQLAVSAGAGYDLYSRWGTLFVFSAAPVGGVEVAHLEKGLREEIENLQTELIEPAELERVKAQVVAGNVYERDSMYYQAMLLGMLETVGLGWQRVDEYVGRVQAVTAEQVRAVARKYLVEERLTRAELVPQSNSDVQADGGREQL